jgi:hypothetical protein
VGSMARFFEVSGAWLTAGGVDAAVR